MELNIYKQYTETTDGRKTADDALIALFRAGVIVSIMMLVLGVGMVAAEQLYVNENGWWRAGGAPIQAAGDASISGRVCEEDGVTPIEGVTVKAGECDIRPFEFVCESTTDADGTYIITNLSAGDYCVYAYAPEYGREFYNDTYFWNDAQPVSVIEGEETPNINFSLGPGGSISGTITSADSGTPLSQVSVFARFADGIHGAWAGLSDDNGNYTIISLPYSTYKVLSPSYARFGSDDDNYIMEFWQENATWDDADIVTVAEGINPMGINFTLEVSGTISGYVYQEDGVTPLSNVHIHANDYDTNEWMDGTNTDQDGFYSLVLPNGTYRVRACPSCNGINYVSKFYDNTFWHHEAQPVSVNAPDNTPNTNFTLEPGGTISGTVRDSQGNLLAGVSVECDRIDGPGGEGAETRSDGTYTIEGLPFGTYKVSSPSGGRWGSNDDNWAQEWYYEATNWNDADDVAITSDNPNATGVDFTLEVGGIISGYVYQDDGVTPLPDVHVYAEDFDTDEWMDGTDTDQDGFYSLVLPNGTYRVRANPSENGLNYVSEWYNNTYDWDEATAVSVTAPDETPGINFTLEPGGTISGTVRDSQGNLLAGVSVECDRIDGPGGEGAETRSDGTYTIEGLPFGTYKVSSPSGGRWGSNDDNWAQEWYYEATNWNDADDVAITSDNPNATGVDFTLEVGGTVSGYVYEEDGITPLQDVHVYAEDFDMDEWMAGTDTDQDGFYSLVLPNGTYRVRASPSENGLNYVSEWYNDTYDWDEATAVSVTAPNETPGINFTLEPGGTISGYVYQEDGVTPLPDVHVHAVDFDTYEWIEGTNTDQDGFYSLVLPNGTYHVCTCGFCCSELPYAGECYDGPVSVTVPDDAQNINFTLVSIVRRATIEEAIADGVAWLAAEQNPDGSWGSQYQVAKTALAVLNLETHATEIGYSSPFDPAYNYSDEIESGLNYLFSHAHIISISDQTHDGISDNPDTNGNGTGIYFRSPDLPPDHGCVDIYETSIAVMGIAASTYPARVVNVTGSAVDGWTYEDVLQDAVDYLAWAQTDSGFGRGGWNYEPMDNSGDRSDQSNSGWVTLGLAYAEAPSYGFELTIPGFVRSELDIWIDYIQNDVDGDTDDGGSDYTGPDDPDWDWNWVNVLKTGNLLQQMAFVGDTATTQRAQDAIDYIVMHWNEDNGDPGWRGCPTCYHATYTTMKGLEALNVTTIDSIDWFHEFTDALLPEQTIDGWWMVSCFDDGEGILSTEWALLTLQKRIPRITKPDLTVLEKHEEWVDEGNGTYRVFYTVKNRGNMEAPAGHNVSLTVDGAAIEQKTVPVSLAPAATYSGSFDMVLSVGQEYHEIVVCADSTGMVDELNEDNNCLVNFWPATVSIESAACSVGGTVNVPINITGASNIGAMDISVTYDASVLTATGVANGMMITSLPNVIVAHDISAGRVNISFATYPETVNGDGELFVVTFDADAAGNSTLDITVEEAWTGDVPPQPVAPVTVNGYVNVTSTTPSHDPADTNHDCVVDMMELMAHISKWKSGEVGMMELMTSIGRWKLGTGGYC